ncbi:hypothetical protein ACIG87_18385 [Micromonospora sp. NPDC051925]|uniref:hypothetical protein n=1 Tax=Micromonospora sp. NPDC051925 TaxID=3364288 RepID=UPI0037CA0B2E
MLALVIVLVTVPVLVLPMARALHRVTRKTFTPVREWARTATYLLIAAGEAYLFGLVHMESYWGVSPEDACVSRYGNWDGMHGDARYWPLERKCTEYIDMVPSYVNPLIIILLIGALACALIMSVYIIRQCRTSPSTPS